MMYAFLMLALAGEPGDAPQVQYANTPSPPPAIISVQPNPGVPSTVINAVGPPPPVGPIIVSPAKETRPAQSYVSAADYPPSAIAGRQEGRVRMDLTIGPDGRVRACTIIRSSGSAALDATSCRLLTRRARFIPARDSHGMPATGHLPEEIVWRLPG